MVNYFILSSSSLVCVIKKEREEREKAEFATTKCELGQKNGSWTKKRMCQMGSGDRGSLMVFTC